jgi:predicted amidohydrolase
MDLRVELKNFEPPIDIVLNPAFTPVTADFKATHFDARRSIYAYCFFANVAEFGDSLIYTPEKDRTERIIPAKEEGLIYKDIDLFKLRSERKKWEKEQKKEKGFIQSTR